jgi:hypothetical protein
MENEETPRSEQAVSEKPQTHPKHRLMMGLLATIVVAALLVVVYGVWGDQLHDICFGGEGSCDIDAPQAPFGDRVDDSALPLAPPAPEGLPTLPDGFPAIDENEVSQ